jgi:hypothetical protein
MATPAQILRVQVLAKISALLSGNHTRLNGRFQKYARLARLADISQAVLRGLAGLANIRQTILRDPQSFAKPFCEDSPDSQKPSFASIT